ncbi:MAG: hypothetical protein Q7W30_09985 [Coriobacteriia bacterium]|nr:hypothetical protein [Coriobacteriia bacterium]
MEMLRFRAWPRRVVAALAVVCVCAVVPGCTRQRVAPYRPGAPLAAVLAASGDGSQVVVIDLEAATVVRRVALRSFATDIGFDSETGLVVSAQAGGVGPEADDVVGVIDPRRGNVDYVRLRRPNPGGVVCLDGRAYVLHGWIDEGGQYVSVVDLARRTVSTERRVADGAGMWNAAAGLIWTTAAGPAGTGLVSVAPSTFATRVIESPEPPNAVVATGAAVYLLGGRAITPLEPARASIARIEPDTGAVLRESSPAGLRHGAVRGAVAGDTLAVIDWIGEDPESGTIALLSSESLAPRGEVRVDGVPCSLGGWGRTVVAVDRRLGRLMLIDTDTRRVRSWIDLGTGALIHADVEVIPAARTP